MHRTLSLKNFVIIALFLALFAAGCVPGSTGPSRYFVLSPMLGEKAETQTLTGEDRVSVGIGPLDLPGYLDRPQIVTQVSENRISLGEFDIWAESLDDNFIRVLMENLSTLLRSEPVVIFPFKDAFQTDYQVKVDVMRMDGTLGGDAVLTANWAIFREGRTELLVAKRSTYKETVDGETYETLVAAQSRAVLALSRDIAAEIKSAMQKLQ